MVKNEKRTFQIVVAVASVVPLMAGLAGIFVGPRFVGITQPTADLVSHFGFLSGVLLGVWLGFVSCLPHIETHGARFRLMAVIIVLGGVARLYALMVHGAPTIGHLIAIALELGLVPVLVVWQVRIARKYRAGSSPTA